MRRREFIAGLGGAAAWSVAARAQEGAAPGIWVVSLGSADAFEQTGYVAAFRKGLGETGYVEGQNVTVEYHWLEGPFDRLPALMADFGRRRVAVSALPHSCARALRSPLRLARRILVRPPRANCHLGGAREDCGGLSEPGFCRS